MNYKDPEFWEYILLDYYGLKKNQAQPDQEILQQLKPLLDNKAYIKIAEFLKTNS